MKDVVFWDVTRGVVLVKTEVSVERIATIIGVTRIDELGPMLVITSN
jgi:hypothetical protein